MQDRGRKKNMMPGASEVVSYEQPPKPKETTIRENVGKSDAKRSSAKHMSDGDPKSKRLTSAIVTPTPFIF